MRIPSPSIQKVIPLKPFPIQRIVTVSVPSQESPIQSVVTLQLAPVHRIVEIPIPTVPIQQIVPLQITPPMKLIASPVSPHTKTIFELSFFWNPEIEITNENTNENENEKENENENDNENENNSEFSFFWISQGVNEDIIECASVIAEFTSLPPNPIITCKVASFPIQNVLTMHRVSSFCERVVTVLIVLVYIAPPLISKTRIITKHESQNKRHESQNMSPESSLSHFKDTHQFSMHKAKITSLSSKPQFSGSCVIKSHQLHLKDRLMGTGWKKKRKVLYHSSSSKELNLKSFFSKGSSLMSWRFKKKKSA